MAVEFVRTLYICGDCFALARGLAKKEADDMQTILILADLIHLGTLRVQTHEEKENELETDTNGTDGAEEPG